MNVALSQPRTIVNEIARDNCMSYDDNWIAPRTANIQFNYYFHLLNKLLLCVQHGNPAAVLFEPLDFHHKLCLCATAASCLLLSGRQVRDAPHWRKFISVNTCQTSLLHVKVCSLGFKLLLVMMLIEI